MSWDAYGAEKEKTGVYKMRVTVAAILPENLSPGEMTWLIHFRKAKSLDTLNIMLQKAERDHLNNLKAMDDINTGYCAREYELQMLLQY